MDESTSYQESFQINAGLRRKIEKFFSTISESKCLHKKNNNKAQGTFDMLKFETRFKI